MADQKLTQLTELTAPATEDLIYTVDDPSGTPTGKKLTIDNLLKVIGTYGLYTRDSEDKWQIKGLVTAADRYTIQTPTRLSVDIDDTVYRQTAQADIDLSTAGNWDTTTPTDYTVAANRAGKDFYIYACHPTSGTAPVFKLSANSTVPSGYTASNSRKIGGFHCLCVAVGTISGHDLTGFVAGDVLTESIWDIDHRPTCSPEGMVYSDDANLWIDIYLASGTGSSTASVYGGTITDSRNWMDFVDDGGAVGKRMLKDPEFQLIATGSNEETNITGSADPGTTGGHSDTAGRRMISNIGAEDCAGVMWQWLDEQSYRYDGGGHTHTQTITHKATPTGSALSKDQAESKPNATLGSGADETITSNSTDPVPSWGYYNLPGSKGSMYRQGTYGDIKLLAGGGWVVGSHSGSRCRSAYYFRWAADSALGCRFGAEPK